MPILFLFVKRLSYPSGQFWSMVMFGLRFLQQSLNPAI